MKKNKNELTIAEIATILLLILAGLFWLFVAQLGGEKRSRKSELAGRYHLNKTETLMNWISIFCPSDIADKYVGSKKHYIKEGDIFTHLGSPEDYPKDDNGQLILGKAELATALSITPKTFFRRMSEIENFEEEVGMTWEQYKKLKQLPPKHINQIMVYFQAPNGTS